MYARLDKKRSDVIETAATAGAKPLTVDVVPTPPQEGDD
jgi:hypothetical protein